jgi:hypothetical protein
MKKLSIALALVACLFTSIGLAQTVAPVGPIVTYEVKAPNGKTYQIVAPDGSTDLQVWQELLVQHPEAGIPQKGSKGKAAPPAAPRPQTTMQDLYDALRKAHAAGDTVAAQHIADYIKSVPTTKSGVDLSKLSDADLDAIISGNTAGVSDTGRRILTAQGAQIAPRVPTPTTINSSTTAATSTPATSTPPTSTSFNESIAIGLVLGGLLWLVGRWQWRKLNNEADHSGKAKLESAKNFLFVTLGVDIVATSGVVASYAWAVATLKDMSSGLITADQSLNGRLSALDSLFWVLIFTTIGVGVGLVKWLNACYLYAKEVIGATGFKNEKWTAGSWIIPIFNLFKPYQIINEIYKCSAPGYGQPDGWKKESWSGPLLTWWIFWALIHFIWMMASRELSKMSMRTDISYMKAIGTIEFQTWILASSVVIALLWFVVAGSLTRRLLDRSGSIASAPVIPSHQSPPQPPGPPSTSSHQPSNFAPPPSPVVARESTQSTPKPQVTTSEEEALYEQALNELNANKKPGLWAMALAQTANGGNPEGAYIALRVEQLKQEKLRDKEQEITDSSAAEFDYKFAMLHYTNSEHVEPSIHTAFDHFVKAARRGHPAAQEKLASMYWNGSPAVTRDIATAFAWCSIAAENGNNEARVKLPLIKQQMSPADLARAIEIQGQLRNEQAKSGEDSPKVEAVPIENLANPSAAALAQLNGVVQRDLASASKSDLTADKFNSIRAVLIQYRSPIDAGKLLRLSGYDSFKPGEDLRAPLKYAVCKSVDATIIAEFDSEMELVDWVVSQVEVVGASHRV